jgi:glucose dehydrogenase
VNLPRLFVNSAVTFCVVVIASVTHSTKAQSADVSEAVSGEQRSPSHVGSAQNWYTGGRDLGATYYSPLTQINSANVGRLGFAWQFVLDGMRGQEATPIVIDGVMYTSGSWGLRLCCRSSDRQKAVAIRS